MAPAYANEKVTLDGPGTDHSVIPSELTVFACRTADLGPWPVNARPVDPNMPNLDWVREQDTGRKICRRSFVEIEDQTALVHPELVPMNPDTTNLQTCARMALQIDQDKLLGQGSSWSLDAVVCPQRVLDERGRTTFKKPDCPMDATCTNEPTDL